MKDLKYNISDWSQATACLSNNSKDLHIHVSSLFSDAIEGQLVSVNHPCYGVLFAAMTYGHGTIITDEDEQGVAIDWMTTDEILTQLRKFGFEITYEPQKHLPADQISYLTMLYNLGFQHITTMYVYNSEVTYKYVVAFNGSDHPEWLTYPVSIPKKVFDKAALDGTVFNVSKLQQTDDFRWDWLTYIASIQDILRENPQQ